MKAEGGLIFCQEHRETCLSNGETQQRRGGEGIWLQVVVFPAPFETDIIN